MLPLRKKYLLPLVMLTITSAILFHCGDAFAQISLSGSSTGTVSVAVGGNALFSSGTNFLNALVTLLTTTWAQLIGVIAVVFLAIACMTGRIHLHLACSVIAGIILIFSASSIVSSIASAAQ